MPGGSRHDLAAMIMTEDAKTEENTAEGPCGAYIETPCKFLPLAGRFLSHFQMSLIRSIIT